MEALIPVLIGGIALVVAICISAIFLLWGARIAGIEDRTFGKAVGTTILSSVASTIISFLFSLLPVIGTIIGFVVGFLVAALIMMGVFRTSFGKALGATIIAWVLSVIILGGLAFLLVATMGGLAALTGGM